MTARHPRARRFPQGRNYRHADPGPTPAELAATEAYWAWLHGTEAKPPATLSPCPRCLESRCRCPKEAA